MQKQSHNETRIRKHALIFGGTKGIGRATANLFLREHQLVSAIGRDPPVDEIFNRESNNIKCFKLDLRKHAKINKVLDQVIKDRGFPDSIIFCQRYRGKAEDWAGELDVGLTATKTAIEFFADKLNATRSLAIVITSSVAGEFIVAEQPLGYHVGKAALNQLVRYYAVTLGEKGVRVNGVSPGTILKKESRDFYLQNKPLRKLYRQITPLGRMITAEETAEVIYFLCSSCASAITGQNIILDGGLFLRGQAALARELKGI